jgi:hypothetical protein
MFQRPIYFMIGTHVLALMPAFADLNPAFADLNLGLGLNRTTPEAQRQLSRIREEGIDLWLERWCLGKEAVDAHAWRAVFQFARGMNRAVEQHESRQYPFWPAFDYLNFRVFDGKPINTRPIANFNIVAEEAINSSIGPSMVLLRSGVKNPMGAGTIQGCLLFSGGDLAFNSLTRSIVFSDGSVQGLSCESAVVLATGDLAVRTLLGCVVITDGKLDAVTVRNCVIFARGGINAGADVRWTKVLRPNENPFASLKLFCPADIGLDVSQVHHELHIAAVKKESPFGRVGLQQWDIITAVNGKPITDYQDLRKLIRRAYAEESSIALTVRRVERVIDVKIAFKKEPK